MAKEVKLKCGHTVNVQNFKPVKTERGTWMLEGFEPDCNRTVKVRLGNKAPSIPTMSRWVSDGIAKALDGCEVEPDGDCEHGCPSWLRALGYI